MRKVLALVSVIGSLLGCEGNSAYNMAISGKCSGYEASIAPYSSNTQTGREIVLQDSTGQLRALDLLLIDGRIDYIDLRLLPKGSPLERYANPDSLSVCEKALERQYIEGSNQ